MRWLKNLMSGSRTPPAGKRAKPQSTSPPMTPMAKPTSKTPKMVPRDFIDLTEGEAFLICEMVGGEYLGHDSRLTISERLAEAVEGEVEMASDEGADTSAFMLDYWKDHEVDATALPERLRPLSSKQAQCIISAAKKFWRLEDKGDSSEAQELIDVGLI